MEEKNETQTGEESNRYKGMLHLPIGEHPEFADSQIDKIREKSASRTAQQIQLAGQLAQKGYTKDEIEQILKKILQT